MQKRVFLLLFFFWKLSEKNQFTKKDFPPLVAAQTNLMSWENITIFKGDDFIYSKFI